MRHEGRDIEKAKEELAEFEKPKKLLSVKVKTLHTSSGARFGGYWKKVKT